MAIFMIETESVSSSGDSIKTISSELSSISSNVSGYDVNCEDNFNFAGAKQVIAHNIEACVNKMNNTSKLIETVVSAHNNLQSQLKFNKEKNSEDTGKSGSVAYASSGNYSGSYSGSSGGSSHSGGGYSSGGYSGGSSFETLSSAGLVSGGVASALVGNANVSDNQKLTDGITSPLLNEKFLSVAYAAPNGKSLNEDAKKFLNDSNLLYKGGYAMVDGRYVISCDSSYGKVGDIIRFTKNDGSIVECVIGVNTSSEKYKSTLNFIVDKDNPPTSKSEFFEKIVENSSKIENIGNVSSNTNSSFSNVPVVSFLDSFTLLFTNVVTFPTEASTSTKGSENSTTTESNSTVTESTENSSTTESNSDATDSTGTSIESDEPVTNDEKLTPVDNSADSVMANNTSSSFSDESLNSLINAKTDEDVQRVVNSIINDSSNNSNNA